MTFSAFGIFTTNEFFSSSTNSIRHWFITNTAKKGGGKCMGEPEARVEGDTLEKLFKSLTTVGQISVQWTPPHPLK